jgi:hypothetical protein
MNYKVAKVIGLNTDQQAAQALFNPWDKDNVFLGVLDLTTDDAFTRGRQLLNDIEDLYFEVDGTIAQKLTKIFEEAKSKLTDVEKYSILVAVVSGKVLYLLGEGSVGVYLNRENKLSNLLDGGNGQLISGFLQSGDRVLLSTLSLKSFLGDNLKRSLTLSADDWEEEIASRIANPTEEILDEGQDGLAALLLDVKEEVEESMVAASESATDNLTPITIPTASSQLMPSSNQPRFNPLPKLTATFAKAGQLARFIPSSKRLRVILAIVLIGILIGVLSTKFIGSKNVEKTQQINSLLALAKEDINTANGLKTLNPPEAISKLNMAKEKINQALAIDPKNQAAQDLQREIENSGALAQSSQMVSFNTFLDLNLIKEGFSANSLSLSGGKVIVLDTQTKSLAEIDLGKKNHQILAGKDQLGNGEATSLSGGISFVYSPDKGIVRVDNGSKKASVVTKPDNELGDVEDIYGFSNNVYLLALNQIWKYIPAEGGYSNKRAYLAEGTKVDFNNALRLQIESSVYVLKQNGEILRFTKGEADNFSYNGLDKNVNSPKSFFVSSDTDNLYLLDSGNSRLLVLSKTGQFIKQYQGDKFASASDLVVDETLKRAYVLDNNQIFQTDLN